MGHTEPITQLQTLVTMHTTRGTPQRSLISASKDGLIKVWDLQRQCCLGTHSDPSMSKVNDFVMIGELGLLVTASVDGSLRLFQVQIGGEGNPEESKEQLDESAVNLKYISSFAKESSQRALQLSYDRKR